MNNSEKQMLGFGVVFINSDYNPMKYLTAADGEHQGWWSNAYIAYFYKWFAIFQVTPHVFSIKGYLKCHEH